MQSLEEIQRVPETLIEAQIAAILKEAGALSYEKLVHRVADELYQAELRGGAAVLDIGIFGSRLFERAVVDTIRAADNILWKVV